MKKILLIIISLFSLLILTGCPWGQVRIYPDETAKAVLIDGLICFYIPNDEGYSPVFLSINPRSTPSKDKAFIDKPDIHIESGRLCLTSDVYSSPLESGRQYILEVILQSKDDRPRHFVIGFEMTGGRVLDVHLTDMEILRPYDEMDDK